MPWTERQVAMLAEMGVRVWPQPGAASTATPKPPPAATTDAATSTDALPHRAAIDTPAPTSAAPRAAAPLVASAQSGQAVNVEALDWPALKAAVSACQACGLCAGRKQTVFGVGHEQAHWMIVGEAPGEQEDREGEPFVGKSGQLLDHMLHAAGLTRQPAPPERQVFIANAVKCRPPGNRNPTPEELTQCRAYLDRQVALVRPRLILAMGRFAVQSLLHTDTPLGQLRGQVHRYQEVPVVVTYHPAYLLRTPREKARGWDDLCLALDVMQGHHPL